MNHCFIKRSTILITKIYQVFEEKYSSTLRVILVLATTATLLVTGFLALSGYIESRTEADVVTKVDAASFTSVEDLLFEEQIEELDEEEESEDEEEEKEKEFPAYVKTIHGSIQKHFKDERANREIFKDMFKLETLDGILNLMKAGRWPIGNSTRDYQVDLPENDWGCISGTNTTPMNDDQFDQFTDHMIKFWKSAERGTDSDSSQFNKTIDYYGRMGQIMTANDMLLCSFNASLNGLAEKNMVLEMEAQGVAMAGAAKVAAAGYGLDLLFKFFASFSLVVIALILYRILRTLPR